MEQVKLINNATLNKVTTFIGDFNINGNTVVKGFIDAEVSVKDYLLSVSNGEKITSALKMVLYKKNLDLPLKNLCLVDKKKVELAYLLCKKEKYIVLEYFDKGLSGKEKAYFKKLFKKLNSYNITVLIHTNDLNFMFDVTDKICLVKNDSIYKIINKDDYLNREIYDYIDKPKIIEFSNYCQLNGIPVEVYTDLKDLIKAIYRMVG